MKLLRFLPLLLLLSCSPEDDILDIPATVTPTNLIKSNLYTFQVVITDSIQLPNKPILHNHLTIPSYNTLEPTKVQALRPPQDSPLACGYTNSLQWFCSTFYQSPCGIPLYSVSTSYSRYSSLHLDDSNYSDGPRWYASANRAGWFKSTDMNKGKGAYIYAYFGTNATFAKSYYPDPIDYNSGQFFKFYFDNTYNSNSYYTLAPISTSNAPITGLRLVIGHGDNDHPVITEDNVVWTPCMDFSGAVDDFNEDGGGDWLFLYYTTSYTGRKLMLNHPDHDAYAKLIDWYVDPAIIMPDSVKRVQYWDVLQKGGRAMPTFLALNFPMTYIEETTSISNASTVAEIKKALELRIAERYISKKINSAVKSATVKLIEDNFDFVRCYELSDGKLTPVDEGYPANFNRGKSEYRTLMSYSYITPSHSAWSKF